MKCSLLTLSCALDGELSRERQSELETHLVTCERCRIGMRYLREETERISQLTKVTVSAGTATALLERSRVITEPPAVDQAPPAAASTPPDAPTSDVDPFNLMGIGAQIIEVAPAMASPPVEPVADLSPDGSGTAAGPEDDPAAPTPASHSEVSSHPEATHPAEPEEPPEDSQSSEDPVVLGAGGSDDMADDSGAPASAEDPADSAAPVTDEPRPMDQTDASIGAAAVAEDPSLIGTPPAHSGGADSDLTELFADEAVDAPSTGRIPVSGTIPTSSSGDLPSPSHPAADGEQTPEAGGQDSEVAWLEGSPPPSTSTPELDGDPPPMFVPFYLPAGDPGGQDAIALDGDLDHAVPYGYESEEDEPLNPARAAGERREGIPDQPRLEPSPSPAVIHESDEVMQVALEESALLDELSELDRQPADPLSRPPERYETVSIPPPPSIAPLSGAAVAGWEPNSKLNLDYSDIAAARPQSGVPGLGATPDRLPPATGSPMASPSSTRFGPTRPADSTAPLRGGTLAGGAIPPRRRPKTAARGADAVAGKPPPAAPRSWTRTATIAIAALAVFLIGWTLLHHSQPTVTSPAHQHLITPTKINPTPGQSPQPTSSPGQAVVLSNTQSFGGTGSGYQVQGVRYGLHQNNTQLWVVFQLLQGSGPPKITTGFDGATSLYVEMAGVAAGAAVSQPASGGLVTSIEPTPLQGFSGAVYDLQLSRSTQILSAYLLPGSSTGPAGERVVLELQN